MPGGVLVNPYRFAVSGFVTQPSGGSGWGHRLKITIPSTALTADLGAYAALVDLSAITSSAFWSSVRSDGGDIRVTTSNGTTELPQYVREIDTVAETGLLYFGPASVSSSADTDFYLYFNKPAATAPAVTATYGRNNIFNTIYKAVWWFDADPSGSAPQLTDVTGNAHHGTSQGSMVTGDLVAGKWGGAWNFNGTSQYVTVADHVNFTTGPGFGIWAVVKTSSNTNMDIFAASTGGGAPLYRLQTNISGSTTRVRGGANDGTGYFRVGTTDIDTGAWFMVGISYPAPSSTTEFVFVNGASEDSSNIGTIGTINPNTIEIGALTATNYWNGDINEIRLAIGSAWGTDRVAADYKNYFDIANFITIGSVEVSA